MKKVSLLLCIPLLLSAHTLTQLYEGLKNRSQTMFDELVVKKADAKKQEVYSNLYPKIDLIGKYDNYSLPTGMIPLAPNHMLKLVQDSSHPAQPFSYNIYAAGVTINMPLFVKSIYTMAQKAQMLQQSAAAKKEINLIKNEAVIVSANANLTYLNALSAALNAKKSSLLEMKKTVEIKVQNGRSSEAALYMIDDKLNQIDIANNSIQIQKNELVATIETLTGISLDAPVSMQLSKDVESNDFDSLNAVREKIKADKLDLKAQKETLYPSLYAHGSYFYSQGEAYNSKSSINEEYGNVGVVLKIPLVDKSRYDEISLASIEVSSGEVELQKFKEELNAKSKALNASFSLLENSKKLYVKSIEEKKKLLQIAKLNYLNERLSTEEYLRYEDEVVAAEADLYKSEALKWQALVQLAVIYANNIEEMIK